MKQLEKLMAYLAEHGYEYSWINETGKEVFNRHQIIVYKDGVRQWDVICQYGSYGYQEGLLEIMNGAYCLTENGDSVEGYLTADEIIRRLEDGRG